MTDEERNRETKETAREDIALAVDIGRPVIKSILGFLIYLRFGPPPSVASANAAAIVEQSNATAEAFISVLESDLRK